MGAAPQPVLLRTRVFPVRLGYRRSAKSTEMGGGGAGVVPTEEMILDEPDIWSVAEEVPIPPSAHEYNIRKALNDAAYRGLDYVAFDPNMPINKAGCPSDEVQWVWKKKAPK